jgi:hypothetical protein
MGWSRFPFDSKPGFAEKQTLEEAGGKQDYGPFAALRATSRVASSRASPRWESSVARQEARSLAGWLQLVPVQAYPRGATPAATIPLSAGGSGRVPAAAGGRS